MFIHLINAIPFPDWISPNIFSIGNFSVKWYGLSFIAGIYLALLYAISVTRRKEDWIPASLTRGNAVIPSKTNLDDLMMYALFGIIIGGRIGSVLLYNIDKLLSDPLYVFRIWEGGMSFHGGFLGVCLACFLFSKRTKIELWRVADMAAIGAPIGLFMVRVLGNFFNQELYGRASDVPWAIVFETDSLSLPRHPSQLYEAALEGIALWLIIMLFTRKFKVLTKPGIASGIFILGYGVFRIFVEFFREPDATLFGPFTRGMSYSLPMVIIGLCIILWAARRPAVAPKHMSAKLGR